jgi:hypothetical protein
MRARTPLTPALLTRWRLRHQMLTGAPGSDPAGVVRQLGAVQSQDYPGATWGVALRLGEAMSRRAIDEAFDRGEILRTHLMRPTWHFVSSRDIRWILRLTGPRVIASCRSARSSVGLDAKAVSRAMTALQRALEGGRALGREEIRTVLSRARVACPTTERFAHTLMVAENEGLVCSGPRAGTEHTYTLLDERVAPESSTPTRAESVLELARRYYLTHGPATTHDFTVWSGLPQRDARAALDAMGDEVESAEMDGSTWWFPRAPTAAARAVVARLLPNFDEYYIGFKHRAPLLARVHAAGASPTGYPLLQHLIVVDGQIVGSWRRIVGARGASLTLSPVAPLLPRERAAVEREVPRLEAFHGAALAARWMH